MMFHQNGKTEAPFQVIFVPRKWSKISGENLNFITANPWLNKGSSQRRKISEIPNKSKLGLLFTSQHVSHSGLPG
jgi:hypothetical protein